MRIGSRMLNRRLVVIALLTGVFLGGLFVASKRIGDLCTDSRYCADLSGMHFDAPPLQQVTDDDADHLLTDPTPLAQSSPVAVTPPEESAHKAAPVSPPSPEKEAAPSPSPSPSPPAAEVKAPVEAIGELSGKAAACAGFPDTSNILLVMKTGASEAFNKIPTQLLTNLKCVDNFLFFSDMKQDVAGYQVHDSLATVSEDVKKNNGDFGLYFRQEECTVDQDTCNKDHDAASQAWSLDKYKNVHMAEKAYAMEPNHDWYMFVDADTYVLWSTMVPWLKTKNPAELHYLGSPAMYEEFVFGHGGSGYIVSQAAMKAMFAGKEKVANRWDAKARDSCCGDFVFAYALYNETGVPVESMWPTINGEKPYTLEYGDSQWCQPIATMHHIGSEEVSEFDAFEQARGFQQPMLIKDVFNEFVKNQLVDYRLDWDNLSTDVQYLNVSSHAHPDADLGAVRSGDDLSEVERKAHLSFHDCRETCLEFEDCFQFMYRDEICSLNMKFAHGHPVKFQQHMQAVDRSLSGWIVPRIKEWTAARSDCGETTWPVN